MRTSMALTIVAVVALAAAGCSNLPSAPVPAPVAPGAPTEPPTMASTPTRAPTVLATEPSELTAAEAPTSTSEPVPATTEPPMPPTATTAPTAIPPTATTAPTAMPPTAIAAPVAAVTCEPPRSPTVANSEGPYYTPDAPFRASLLEPGMPGTRLVITGQVMLTDCTPAPGAVLDFWQADSAGVYDNVGYVLRGRQEADASGRYRLETVLPGEYPGRPPHIHVKVNAPGGPVLTTQIYFAGQPGNDADNLIQPSLITTPATEADGSLSASFDFILAP